MNKLQEFKYLRHSGEELDVKVTVRTLNNEMKIFIRDQEFSDFRSPLRYLRQIANEEFVGRGA